MDDPDWNKSLKIKEKRARPIIPAINIPALFLIFCNVAID
jgi:hypothetical protein